MRHTLHRLLLRWLSSEQCAFDCTQREGWPAEGFIPSRGDASLQSGTDSIHGKPAGGVVSLRPATPEDLELLRH